MSGGVETAVDPGTGKSTHVIFGFHRGCETSLAGEFKVVPVGEIDMALPGPGVGIAVFPYDRDESLVTMRLGNLVPGALFNLGFHVFYCSACRGR